MNSQKITLAVVLVGVVLAVAIAPVLLSQADAARTTTTSCTTKGGQPKECGSPPANCQTSTVKAGEGKGKGEIKGSSTECSTP
jgi:hypothetical protein